MPRKPQITRLIDIHPFLPPENAYNLHTNQILTVCDYFIFSCCFS
jgi:hypothetical protein